MSFVERFTTLCPYIWVSPLSEVPVSCIVCDGVIYLSISCIYASKLHLCVHGVSLLLCVVHVFASICHHIISEACTATDKQAGKHMHYVMYTSIIKISALI